MRTSASRCDGNGAIMCTVQPDPFDSKLIYLVG